MGRNIQHSNGNNAKKDGYLVEGKSYHPGYEKKNQIQPFQENIDSLPACIKTSLGTLTLTASQRFQMQTGETYIVTILPPMQI